MESPFIFFGPAHVTVLVLTAAIPLLLWMTTRRFGAEPFARGLAHAMGILLLSNQAFSVFWKWHTGTITLANGLPMHLCDWTTFLAIIACFGRKPWAYELTYFWGLAGTIQALLTPDLHEGFPAPEFLIFFIGHSGVIISILYLTLAFRLRPHWSSIPRAFGWLLVYATSTGLVNWSLGTNYGYLCSKPVEKSLLDYMGPWPWYIGVGMLLAAVFFVIDYLPFAIWDGLQRRRNRATCK